MKAKLIARLREPSTYAGIAATILIIPTPSAMALAGTVKEAVLSFVLA
jgi:hypothetical protein